MAKANGGSSNKIKVIIGVVLLVGIIAAIAAISLISKQQYDAYAQNYGKFYVDISGRRYYDGGKLMLNQNSITTLDCGYVGTATTGKDNYDLKITSTTTEETAFTYTLNGATRMFLDGEDYTQYFDVTVAGGSFKIANVKDTPATILQRRFAGSIITAPATDAKTSFFTLTVYSKTDGQSISFALYFGDVNMSISPGGITF